MADEKDFMQFYEIASSLSPAQLQKFIEILQNLRPVSADEFISQSLLKLGIYPNLSGYHYLMELIKLGLEDTTLIFPLTTFGYVYIAERHSITINNVERNINNAIKKSFANSNKDFFNKVFTCSRIATELKASNSEYIATLIEFCKYSLK